MERAASINQQGVGRMANIRFKDTRHEQSYKSFLNKMENQDCYHKCVAYLLGIDEICAKHINYIFDFQQDIILIDCLVCPWQTSTTLKICRLAFNLWNDCCIGGGSGELPSVDFTPSIIFNTSLAPYFWQAVMIRFPFLQDLEE